MKRMGMFVGICASIVFMSGCEEQEVHELQDKVGNLQAQVNQLAALTQSVSSQVNTLNASKVLVDGSRVQIQSDWKPAICIDLNAGDISKVQGFQCHDPANQPQSNQTFVLHRESQ